MVDREPRRAETTAFFALILSDVSPHHWARVAWGIMAVVGFALALVDRVVDWWERRR